MKVGDEILLGEAEAEAYFSSDFGHYGQKRVRKLLVELQENGTYYNYKPVVRV
jgi:hypothetical protein